MDSIIANPKNEEEFRLIKALLEKMGIENRVISYEEIDDLGLSILMKDIDRTDKVSEKNILTKLKC
ncbi:hypothetical protein [Ekhidna sp.]|uniref:hypothetical protein n=1 Tax=Ekhidna sp. TaxID=2608089 RepID=UPI0032EC7318